MRLYAPSLRRAAGALLVSLAFSSGAWADFVTVGAGCQYGELQDAIDATHGELDEIHVSADYHGKPVHFTRKHLSIFGGYAHCGDAEPIPFTGGNLDDLSWLDGALDNGAKPVVSVDGQSFLDLRNFLISGGHNDGHDGGGIYFRSNGDTGHIELHAVDVNGNRADSGGGIFFHGGAATNDLVLYDYSFVRLNTAHDSGGGIRLEGNTYLLANSAQTTISDNTAQATNDEGGGGGIQLLDGSSADIGSPGFNGTAVIYRNHASNGGGLALRGQARARLYTTVPGQSARIEYNDASYRGGGVHMDDNGQLCISGGGINNNEGYEGGAVAIEDSEVPSTLQVGLDCGQPPGAIACPQDRPCNSIDANRNSSGWVIQNYNPDARVTLENLAIRANQAQHLLGTFLGTYDTLLANCEISGNTTSGALFYHTGDKRLLLTSCTVAGNAIGSGTVFSNSSALTLSNTIVWQPGKETLVHIPVEGTRFINVIAQDAQTADPAQFDIFTNVRQVDPAFIDATAGDLHLQPFSPAVDCATSGDRSTDLDLHARGVDLPGIGSGPFDIGAYELQGLPADSDILFADGFDR